MRGTLPDGIGAGGILGAVVGNAFLFAFNFLGATVVMLGLLLAGWALFTRVSWLTVMETTGRLTLAFLAAMSGLSGAGENAARSRTRAGSGCRRWRRRRDGTPGAPGRPASSPC